MPVISRSLGPVVHRRGAEEQQGLAAASSNSTGIGSPALAEPSSADLERDRAHANGAGLGYRPVGQSQLVLEPQKLTGFLISSLRAGIVSPPPSER